MSTSGSIYASEPAFPVLAHSLLSHPGPVQNTHIESESTLPQNKTIPSASWDLKDNIDRGISPSGNGVFRCGTVIGFSRLRKKSSEDDHHRITQVSRVRVFPYFIFHSYTLLLRDTYNARSTLQTLWSVLYLALYRASKATPLTFHHA